MADQSTGPDEALDCPFPAEAAAGKLSGVRSGSRWPFYSWIRRVWGGSSRARLALAAAGSGCGGRRLTVAESARIPSALSWGCIERLSRQRWSAYCRDGPVCDQRGSPRRTWQSPAAACGNRYAVDALAFCMLVFVPVAQLDRAPASGAGGYRFESCRGYFEASLSNSLAANSLSLNGRFARPPDQPPSL